MSELMLFDHREVNPPPVDIPLEAWTDNQSLDGTGHAARMEAYWQARKIRSLARFAEHRPPERDTMELADGAQEEVAVELAITPETACVQILRSRDMVARAPATVDALEAGEIDYMRAKAMLDMTRVLTEDQAKWVEQRVLAGGRRTNLSRFRQAIRRAVLKADPAGAAARHQEAKADRGVHLMDLPDQEQMLQLGIVLEAHEAMAAYRQIDRLARRSKTKGQSLEQCRADVFMDLVMGKDISRSEVHLNVTVPLTTLMGLNQHPGELSGFGPITAEYARELAQHASWRQVLTDDAGQVLKVSERRVPTTALREFIQIRDRTCRAPGCNRPAEVCEFDHTDRFADGGKTEHANGAAMCKWHNLMKERSGWKVEQPVPGRMKFTSPANRVYVTEPEPYDMPPFVCHETLQEV